MKISNYLEVTEVQGGYTQLAYVDNSPQVPSITGRISGISERIILFSYARKHRMNTSHMTQNNNRTDLSKIAPLERLH